MYYNNNELMGNWLKYRIFLIVGGWHTGKTYSVWNMIVRKWKKGKIETFVYLRDTNASLINAVTDVTKLIPIEIINKFNLKNIEIKKGVITVNGVLFGYYSACSTFYNKKGSFEEKKADVIFYDEAITEIGQAKRGDRYYNLIRMCRQYGGLNSDTRLIMTSNTLTGLVELTDLLGQKVPTKPGIYKNGRLKTIIELTRDSDELKKIKDVSITGILANNHRLSNEMLKGKIVKNDSIGKLQNHELGRFLAKFEGAGIQGEIYYTRGNNFLYISNPLETRYFITCTAVLFGFDAGSVAPPIWLRNTLDMYQTWGKIKYETYGLKKALDFLRKKR